MFQAYDAGLAAEIAYRRERLAELARPAQSPGGRARRTLRGRRIQGAPTR